MLISRWRKPQGQKRFPESVTAVGAGRASSPVNDNGSDFLSVAVLHAERPSLAPKAPSAPERERAAQIFEAHRPPGDVEEGIAELLPLVLQYPDYERFQVLIARLLENYRDPRAAQVWRGVNERFKQSSEAFRLVLRWAQRDFGYDRAQKILNQRYPEQPTDPVELINYARACEELRNFAEADEAFSRVEQLPDATVSNYAALAAAVRKRGEYARAMGIVERAESRFGKNERFRKLTLEINRDLDHVKLAMPNVSVGTSKEAGSAVLDRLLTQLIEKRTHEQRVRPAAIGSIVMMNSSLGCGGAERQFVNTAVGLQNAINLGGSLNGIDVMGPINVICRSLRSRPGADFFLAELENFDIPVLEYIDFADFGGKIRDSAAKDIVGLLRYLPQPTVESIKKVPDVLAPIRPDIVHIWQDGSILANCISVLLSSVPKIVLGVRTVPPVDRPERNRYEYSLIYRALLSAPGVVLTANSVSAARRYAEWLELDDSRVHVVHNGSGPLATAGSADDERLSAMFDQRTVEDDFIVGSVFRFDENKRPFLWLDAAAKIKQLHPSSRFILVGDGPLLQPAKEYAQRLGLANSVLFVGRSDSVGFWLSKFSVFLLLSRFEGLPNVLIEAQFAGLPVVTTDAGGASETINPGHTGTLLVNTTAPAPEQIAEAVLAWRSDASRARAIAAENKLWAHSRFSIDAMLRKTAEVYGSDV